MHSSNLHVFLLTTVLSLPVSAFAADIEAASHIEKATVYTDGALVVRSASVDIPAGASVIVLKGLPSGLDANSLHVEGHGEAALTIVSVDNRLTPGEAKPSADPGLEARIDAARIERDRTRGVVEATEAQKATILRYAEASPEKLSPETKPLDFDKWPDVWRVIGQGLTDINEKLRDLQQKYKALENEIAALERARPQAGVPGAPKRDVLVSIESDRAMKANLDISYQVAAASWAPLYDARLKTSGDKPVLDLVRRASVQQMTGEDWTGIALTLSTVRLRHGTAAPELATQSLTLVDLQTESEMMSKLTPRPTMARRSLQVEAAPGEPAPMPVPPPPQEVARPRLASVDAGSYETSFIVPGSVDIPRDGTIKSLALTTKTVEPSIGAKLTPSLEPSAYLEASFVNDEEAPLLPGEVALWRDGNLIGKGRFALTAAGDKVKLGFGVDDQVKVTRVPTVKRDNDGGFFNSSRNETQDFKTTIKNLHRFPLHITMIDRIPVSENTAISVEPLSSNTPPTEKSIDDKRGVMGWSYDYKPGEQKDVRLGWRIRWPADRELRRQ